MICYRRQSGKHMLILSFTGCDPLLTFSISVVRRAGAWRLLLKCQGTALRSPSTTPSFQNCHDLKCATLPHRCKHAILHSPGRSLKARACLLAACLSAGLTAATQTLADITVYMNAWDFIPQVVISQGRNDDCGANPVVFSGPMTKGQRLGPFPGTGPSGDDICWIRTADPLNPASGPQPFWTRCSGLDACYVD
jgi:hypothetical protein